MFGKKKNEDYSVKTVKVGIDKLTTIALGTMVKGANTGEGALRLDGIIEGNVSCKGKVVIGPQGRIKGNVTCTGAVLQRDVTGRYSGGRRFGYEIGMYNEWRCLYM